MEIEITPFFPKWALLMVYPSNRKVISTETFQPPLSEFKKSLQMIWAQWCMSVLGKPGDYQPGYREIPGHPGLPSELVSPVLLVITEKLTAVVRSTCKVRAFRKQSSKPGLCNRNLSPQTRKRQTTTPTKKPHPMGLYRIDIRNWKQLPGNWVLARNYAVWMGRKTLPW